MIYFCPSCWTELDRDYEHCPSCGCDIEKLSRSQDYIDKLIAALNHPEPETPIRAVWILGRLCDKRAIRPLYDIACKTSDTFLRVAAIKALVEIGTAEANELATKCLEHVSEVERLMVTNRSDQPDSLGKKEQANGGQ